MLLLFATLGFPSSRTPNRNLSFLVSRPRSGPSSLLTTDQHFAVSAPSKLNNVIFSKLPAFILVVTFHLLTTIQRFFVGQALG